MILRKVLVSLFVMLFLSGCVTTRTDKDHWFSKDKRSHFFISSLIAATTTSIAENEDIGYDESFGLAFGVTLLIGAGKEIKDEWSSQSGWSYKDIVWDILGGVTGFFVAQGIINA